MGMWNAVRVFGFGCAVGLASTSLLVAGAWPQQQLEANSKTSAGNKGPEAPEKGDSNSVEPLTAVDQGPQSFTQGLGELTREFATDQKQIWASPRQLRVPDLQWLVPMGGFTGALIATDANHNQHISHNPNTINNYKNLSNASIAALVGGAGGMWLYGKVAHKSHWTETGFLAGEAALNSLVVVEGMKYSFGRERPYQGNGTGQFFQGGTSFPSEHAAAAWSVAGVLAHEYPGPLMKIAAYSLATLVDISRVRSQQHFPSDVFVGTVLGNFIAQDIYSRHYDARLGGTPWPSFSKIVTGNNRYTPANMGSPYVPLDSWVYPAIDRLAAMGYIQTAIVGMRPWTRLECARLLDEMEDRLSTIGFDDSKALKLYDSLAIEFVNEISLRDGGENRSLEVQSVYSRVTGIAGTPLTEGFYLGQTVLNDFGRPYAQGFNTVDGFSVAASEGRLVAYVRGEYQYAPSIPALPAVARNWIAGSYGTIPVPPNAPTPAVNRFQLLDAYVAMNLSNWQFSIGKQSLWLGPSQGGPMLFSDNSAPVNAFRIDRVTPFKLPWVFGRFFGPTRWQFLLGRLSGQQLLRGDDGNVIGEWGQPLADQPFIVGQKLSFKPTPNFEFGIGYTRITAGTGQPFTTHQFLLAMFSLGNGPSGSSADPGDIRSAVDFTYRIPGLRNWVTLYGDAFTEDEYSPLGYWRKSAYEGGIYMPRIPGIPKLDLRIEGGSSEPADFGTCQGCFYINDHYLSGYTNQGSLMGSWLGRAGQGELAWSTYWFSPRNNIQFGYRHQKAVANFVEGGGTINDAGVKANVWFGATTQLSVAVQYEKWNFPVLSPRAQSNVTSSVGITFWPRNWNWRGTQ